MRRHVALIATVGVLLIAGLAACSDDGSPSTDPTDTEAPDDSTRDEPVDDAAFDAVPVIETTPSPGGIASLPVWFLRADPVGDGDELRVVFPVREPCEMFDRVDVVETDDAVEVTVLTWWSPTMRCDNPQPAWVRTTVLLDAPLGDREIRDGSDDHPFRQGIDRIPEATDELFHVNSRPAEFALLTPDGNAVWATWRGGACDLLEGADVERDGDTVSVALRTGVEAEAQVCTANIVAWWTLVALEEPAAAVTYG